MSDHDGERYAAGVVRFDAELADVQQRARARLVAAARQTSDGQQEMRRSPEREAPARLE